MIDNLEVDVPRPTRRLPGMIRFHQPQGSLSRSSDFQKPYAPHILAIDTIHGRKKERVVVNDPAGSLPKVYIENQGPIRFSLARTSASTCFLLMKWTM